MGNRKCQVAANHTKIIAKYRYNTILTYQTLNISFSIAKFDRVIIYVYNVCFFIQQLFFRKCIIFIDMQ